MSSTRSALVQRAVTTAERATSRLARSAGDASRSSSAVDLAVAASLAQQGISGLHDPVAYVEFLRSCWEPAAFDVHDVTPLEGSGDDASRRFSTLLEHLGAGLAPLPADDAVRIGRLADGLRASRLPFDRPGLAMDVGLHAGLSSSSALSGRLLAAVVRFTRARSVLEVGTAYGLSALFLAASVGERGRVRTVECSEPQLTVSGELLAREHPTTVEAFAGRSGDALPKLLADGFAPDLLFHDAEHSEAAYRTDFALAEPHLAPGAVVLFDDIRWEDPRFSGAARTYQGWQAVTAHPRIRRSAELGDRYGLALLG